MLSLRVFTAIANQKLAVLLIPVSSPLWNHLLIFEEFGNSTVELIITAKFSKAKLWKAQFWSHRIYV